MTSEALGNAFCRDPAMHNRRIGPGDCVGGGKLNTIPLQGNFENPDTLTTFGKEKPGIPHRICKYEVLC